MTILTPVVSGVFLDPGHRFSKQRQDRIRLLEGLGVEGDAHCGAQVKHRYDARKDPTRPNLRQVHLLAAEALDDAERAGFAMQAGDLGENIFTRGIDLTGLPRGTRLAIGPAAVVKITGLRTPCVQIERFRPGLQAAVTAMAAGKPALRGGVMAIVLTSGEVHPGDTISVHLPDGPYEALAAV